MIPDGDVIARRPSAYRAPSWSWLSIDGEIHFARDDNNHSCKVVFDVLKIEIENTGPNPSGSIRSGQILGCGMLRPGRFSITSGNNAKTLILSERVVQEWGRQGTDERDIKRLISAPFDTSTRF